MAVSKPKYVHTWEFFFTPPRVFGEASFGLKSTPLRAFRVEEEEEGAEPSSRSPPEPLILVQAVRANSRGVQAPGNAWKAVGGRAGRAQARDERAPPRDAGAVSYTHLTLPTKRIV